MWQLKYEHIWRRLQNLHRREFVLLVTARSTYIQYHYEVSCTLRYNNVLGKLIHGDGLTDRL